MVFPPHAESMKLMTNHDAERFGCKGRTHDRAFSLQKWLKDSSAR